MRTVRFFFVFSIIALGLTGFVPAQAGISDLLKGAEQAIGGGGGNLSETKIVDGLKEALQIGTGKAVASVSQTGGFWDNPKIRIPLPGSVEKEKSILGAAGYGPQLDQFEMSMNRAAEKAAPEAKGIFLDAIKQMNISDAQKILNGGDNAATLYFKDKTFGRLSEIFKPAVHDSMAQVGVTRQYQELDQQMQSLPFVGGMSFNLDNYVTKGALDGLFYMVGQEEKKIRENPAARVTDLLKQVFGSK
jgi:hypothetical protein